MMRYFYPIDADSVSKLPILGKPVIYALTFNVGGFMNRIGWTTYPASRIPNLITEQAAAVEEIWLADVPMDSFFDKDVHFNEQNALRAFGRGVQSRLSAYHQRNELYRAPMQVVDDAFGLVLNRDALLERLAA